MEIESRTAQAAQPKIPLIRYRLFVSKASGMVWDTRYKDPNPFIEIFLDGKSIHTTKTQSRTIAPVWNECVELESTDPKSMLTLKLCHRRTSGKILRIGSTTLAIQDLVHLANRDVSLALDDNNTKIGVVLIMKRPAPSKQATHSPPELCTDPESPQHPDDPEEILQVVEFSEQNLNMDQATRIIRQSLARGSMD